MRVAIIGAAGFVGSAFVRRLAGTPHETAAVTRANYSSRSGERWDVTIDASEGSRKYFAESRPLEHFEQSVTQRLRTIQDYPALLQLHISSVDVYGDLRAPATTREDSQIDLTQVSNYGLHKLMAEDLVRHYSAGWLVIRLAGMVGPGLRKNPVYDVTRGEPIWIHPDSCYQFMSTDAAASIAWEIVESGTRNEIFNVCGSGLVTPREVGALTGRPLDLSRLAPDTEPRIVDVSIDKISTRVTVPCSIDAVRQYLASSAPEAVQTRTVAPG